MSEVASNSLQRECQSVDEKNFCKWLSWNARCSSIVPIYNQVPESAADLLAPCHASGFT
jgi:hypothetical protein